MYHSSNTSYSSNTGYSMPQPSNSMHNFSFAQPSTSFVAAPAPILRDDGEITVVSNATRTLPMTAPPPSEITVYGAPRNDLLSAPAYSHPATQYSENKYASHYPTTSRSTAPNTSVAAASAAATFSAYSASYKRKPLTEHTQNTTTLSTTNSFRSTDSYRATTPSTQIVPYDSNAQQQPHQTYPDLVEGMKVNRKRATVAAGVTGGAVGLLVLGPVGMVVGAAGASVATRTIGKRRERRLREKISDQLIAEQAKNAPPPLAMTSGELL